MSAEQPERGGARRAGGDVSERIVACPSEPLEVVVQQGRVQQRRQRLLGYIPPIPARVPQMRPGPRRQLGDRRRQSAAVSSLP